MSNARRCDFNPISCYRVLVLAVGIAGCTSNPPQPVPSSSKPPVAAPARPTTWQDVNLGLAVQAPQARLPALGYVRYDGVPAIVYRGVKSRTQDSIYELTEQGGRWQKLDLCAASNPKCSPWANVSAYTRADATSSVLFTALANKQRHIKEIAWERKAWQEWDLTTVSKGPPVDGEPTGYVRGDRLSAVVYCQNYGDIREVAFNPGGWQDTSILPAGGEPAACELCQPYPLALSEGQSLVVYLGRDQHVHALHRKNNAWIHFDLTTETNAKVGGYPCPTAYVRSDGVTSVLYKEPTNGGFRLHEISGIRNATGWAWGDWDFFAFPKPPPPMMQACQGAFCNAGDAYGYVTPADSLTHLIYLSNEGKIQEITLKSGAWVLSVPSPSDAGCAGPAFHPRPYLRKDGSAAIVYLDSNWYLHELRNY